MMKVEQQKTTPYGKYELQFYDGFDSEQLNRANWIPYYLPQWSSREASTPRYVLQEKSLLLRIDHDQPPWCPEFNGNVRVSSLQTGVFSGKQGSPYGQHRFVEACRVRKEQHFETTYTPHYGYIEMRAKCAISPNNVAAFWMIGVETQPEQSAEICIFELKGNNMDANRSVIGYGVHPFGDQTIEDEFYEEDLGVDVTHWNNYAAEWTPTAIHFFVNHRHMRTIHQSPAYAMQLMLNIYDVEQVNAEPMCFFVDYIAGYRPAGRPE